ncbi:MAG TPA: tyrosine-type recombinase/integrase [Acholeplasmataceae bacterium]|nr:tyrosine-type recombinase/integrase [Acholeplasmataceae bacterium]
MMIKETFEKYLTHVQKYRAHGTFLYYRKNFKMILPILNDLRYETSESIDKQFFENITDYFLVNTEKKNSKINDALSCIITALNFSDINYPKRYKLRKDTVSFKVLSEHELDQLLNYTSNLNLKRSNNLSWALAICLFLDTGVRLSELLDIRFKNIDYDNNMILLDHTKNGEKRYVFFNTLSNDLLIQARKKRTEYVLWNYEKNTRLNKRSLEHFFDKLNNSIESSERIHPHRLRKTFATKLLSKGCPLTTISKLLGHKDIRQTMIYLQIDNIMLKKDYNNYYPY